MPYYGESLLQSVWLTAGNKVLLTYRGEKWLANAGVKGVLGMQYVSKRNVTFNGVG